MRRPAIACPIAIHGKQACVVLNKPLKIKGVRHERSLGENICSRSFSRSSTRKKSVPGKS